jgi:hypothetical protein
LPIVDRVKLPHENITDEEHVFGESHTHELSVANERILFDCAFRFKLSLFMLAGYCVGEAFPKVCKRHGKRRIL